MHSESAQIQNRSRSCGQQPIIAQPLSQSPIEPVPPPTDQVIGISDTTSQPLNTGSKFRDQDAPDIRLTVKRLGTIAWLSWLPFQIAFKIFQFASLIVFLAIVSSIPIVQLASLGYMLEAASRVARGDRSRRILPGLDRAGRLGVIACAAFLFWLPVWFVTDYAYCAELISHGSSIAQRWRIAAGIFSGVWVTHLVWAALRGGRWYHFLWPAPIRFLKEIWRPATWQRAEDALWNYTVGLRIPSLMWLGARAAVGAVIWLFIPAAMMIIGMQANQQPIRVPIGIAGALSMLIVLLYLPFLQVQMARENRFLAMFDVRSIRQDFKRAPLAFGFAFLITLLMAIPLYLFRIESLPKELLWLPCLFFILLTLPARLTVGWALRRGHRERPRQFWVMRWIAFLLQLAVVPIYIGFLYLTTLASWDGVLTVFLQHAFLVPVPFTGN